MIEKALRVERPAITEAADDRAQGFTIFDEAFTLVNFLRPPSLPDLFPQGFLKTGMHGEDIFTFLASRCLDEGGAGVVVKDNLLAIQRSEPVGFKFVLSDQTICWIESAPLEDGGIIVSYRRARIYAATQDHFNHQYEKLLEATLENISQGVCLFDEDLNLAIANRRYFELLDLPEKFAKSGTPLEDIIRFNAERKEYGPGTASVVTQEKLRIAKRMEPMHFCTKRTNGTILEIIGTRLEGTGYVTTYEDITAAEKARRSLEQREEQFRTYLEVSPIGAALVALDGKVNYHNSRFLEIFGLDPKDIKGFRTTDLYPDKKTREGFLERILSTDQPYSFQFDANKAGGGTVPVLLTSQIVEIQNQKRILSWINDLTDQTQAQQQIQRLSQQNEMILAAAGAGIFGIDAQDKIRFMNPAATRLLEFEPQELIGQNIFVLFSSKNQMPLELISKFHEKKPHSGETEIRCKSGKDLPVRFTVTELNDVNSQNEKVVVFHDISDRIAAEEVLRQAMLDIEASSQAKSHFLSTMSHELRTPLNAILGFTQILQKNQMSNLNEQQLNFLDHMHQAGEHLLKLLNEAIDIATIENGQITLSKEVIPLQDFLEKSMELSGELAEKYNIQLLPISLEDENYAVIADPRRLQQIIMHLISNAIKYNQKDGHVQITTQSLSDDVIKIIVTDTGRGIDDKNAADIFAPFNRLTMHTEGIEGTGLGLTLCKHLAVFMGCEMGFTTEVDVGTSFWIEVPRASADTPMIVH